MSKTKGGGSTRNGRDSQSKRLGVKAYDGTLVTADMELPLNQLLDTIPRWPRALGI